MRVNRLARVRSDASIPVWPLAMLVALGALEPAEHWQAEHRAVPARVAALWRRLARELVRTGTVAVGDEAFRGLVHEARARAATAELGWVDRDAIDRLAILESADPPASLASISNAA